MAVSIEQLLQLLGAHAAARIRNGQEKILSLFLQHHLHAASGGGKLKGVGEEVIDDLLRGVRRQGADMVPQFIAEGEFHPPEHRQRLRRRAKIVHQLAHVAGALRQGIFIGQVNRSGKLIHQTENLVKALIHPGGPDIQLRVLLPFFRRSKGHGRHIEVAQGMAQLHRHLGQQRHKVIHFRPPFTRGYHMPLSPGATEEKAASFTIKITKRVKKDKLFVESRRERAA